MSTDLFGKLLDPDGPALSDVERKRLLRRASENNKRGHAWKPGTGPAGETCKTCAHYVRKQWGVKAYLKCGLNASHWTSGPRTDIRARDPACAKWERAADGQDRTR